MEPPKQLVDQLIEQITVAFAGVSREGGVSLHETRVLDDCGSEAEMAQARAQDVDVDWLDVLDSSIEKPDLSLNFLDPIGLRYYLPAYMIWELKQLSDITPWIDCNTHGAALFVLSVNPWRKTHEWRKPYFEILTGEQVRAICQFLLFYVKYSDDFEQRSAQEALDNYWGQFL